MRVVMPTSVNKFSNFVRIAKYWDDDCQERAYFDIRHRMNLNEEVYDIMSQRYGNVDELTDDISNKMNEIGFKYKLNKMALTYISTRSVAGKNDMKRLFGDMTLRLADYYADVGKIMDETGILDILLTRTNKTFPNLGLPSFHVDKKQALDEFDKWNNQKLSYYLLNMKTLFQLNKIIKFIESTEYGRMLNDDKIKIKSKNPNRAKLLSNLKTDYLRKVVRAEWSMKKEEKEAFIESGIAENRYYQLFEDEFDNLDYEKDLEIVSQYEEKKGILYEVKSNLTSQLIGITYEGTPRKSFERNIKACGVGIDENKNLLLGMTVYGYIMPFTVHVLESNIIDMVEGEKFGQEQLGLSLLSIPKVEKYKSITDRNGRVYTSNLLFKTNENQRNIIKSAYKNNPTNPILGFMYSQITSKDENLDDREYIDVKELLQ